MKISKSLIFLLAAPLFAFAADEEITYAKHIALPHEQFLDPRHDAAGAGERVPPRAGRPPCGNCPAGAAAAAAGQRHCG